MKALRYVLVVIFMSSAIQALARDASSGMTPINYHGPWAMVKAKEQAQQVPVSRYNANDPHMQCLGPIHAYEKKYGLPQGLLHAVAIVESGKLSNTHQVQLPWPWTVNVRGSGHFFNSYGETLRFVKKSLARGEQKIDVGCGQLNILYQRKFFGAIEQMLDPGHNLDHAAKILAKNYAETNCWHKAVAFYHSRTPDRGTKYARKVHKVWREVSTNEKYKMLVGLMLGGGRQSVQDTKDAHKGKVISIKKNLPRTKPKPLDANIIVFARNASLPATAESSPQAK